MARNIAPDENASLLEIIIVFAAVGCAEFITGGNYGDGVLVAEWVDYFHRGIGLTAWLGTAILGIAFCGAPVANMLARRFGFRKVFFIAATINATSIALTSFAYSIYVAIALRLVAGCGLAIQMNTLCPYIMCRFPKYTAIAQAIRSVGITGGGFAFPFIINSCLKQFGWRGCSLIISGIVYHQCAIGLIFRRWSNKPTTKPEHEQAARESLLDLESGDDNSKKRFNNLHQLELFKKGMFVSFVIHSMVLHLAVSTIYVHIVTGTRTLLEISTEQARFTVSALSLTGLIGRFFASLLTTHRRIDTLTFYLALHTSLAILVSIIPSLKGYTAALVVSGCIGFLLSGISLYPLVLLELFGREYLYMTFAYSECFGGIGYLLGAPIAGWLYDYTNNYAISFYFCTAALIVCVIIEIPQWIVHMRKRKQNQQIEIQETLSSAKYISSVQSLT
ncbi:monocarboxylate transporter 14-like [Tubulanus polymorphus]|uniref:monocarboxylate transporter 14-like n=1 Tax=Tubulanus polymorphus TaxID=672921 RepID=UPI003DA6045C